jgi:amino acid transporter
MDLASVQKQLSKFVSNPVTIAVYTVAIALYTSTVAPRLPEQLRVLYDSKLFSFFIVFFTAFFLSHCRPTVAIVSGLSFLIISTYVAGIGAKEAFVEGFRTKDDEEEA